MPLKKEKIRECCGVFGILCSDFSFSVAESVYHGLMAIQHRGQLFAGISSTNCDGLIYTHKGKGIVSKVLNSKILKILSGNVAIGHVEYGSLKNMSVEDAQPYSFKSQYAEFSIAMNGEITNYKEIYERLRNMGKVFTGKTNIELIATLIETLSRFTENNMIETLKMIMNTVKGAYSIVILKGDGNLYAARDPIGYKPLCYGKLKENERQTYVVASESCALDALSCELKADVKPGEILNFNPVGGIKRASIEAKAKHGICQFEFVYFARPDSIIDGASVAKVRYDLGRKLTRNDKFDPVTTVVIPVPDSGRSAAMGYAWESRITYNEGLNKNRYIWQLKSTVKEKLNPIKAIVDGKDIVLVDDSILSGVTMKEIIEMLRKAGARSVHIRISSPPVLGTCEHNSSFSNRELLIAYQKKLKNNDYIDEIRKYVGADTLKYQTLEGFIQSIGVNKLCVKCLEDKPLKKENKKHQEIKLFA